MQDAVLVALNMQADALGSEIQTFGGAIRADARTSPDERTAWLERQEADADAVGVK
ncbi:MAG: hypothetical protein QOF08_2149 [Gaiellales bacterium]|nr:hypothetical protein [Gaiellales bacterium]